MTRETSNIPFGVSHNGSVLVLFALLIRVDTDEEVNSRCPLAIFAFWLYRWESKLRLAQLQSVASETRI